jgi:hypothetical protein
LEDRIEGRHELAVAVMDQEMHGRLAFLELPDHLSCLLRDP